jgi:hypothetical protein
MSSNLQRHIGGSPGSVVAKLVFLSLLVGAFMHFLGITPVDLFRRVAEMVESLVGNGYEAMRQIGLWTLYGAMIVVPIWLLSRLLGRR